MSTSSTFFVPYVAAADQEQAYEYLAQVAQRTPQPRNKRVRAISWVHNGETWDAIVGEKLRGRRTVKRTIKGKRIEVGELLSDPATVMAIFPGNPFIVVHDGGASHWQMPGRPTVTTRLGSMSRWQNPFMAGRPGVVGYFGDPDAE